DFVCSGEADGFLGSLCTKLIRGGIASIGPGDVPEGLWCPFHRDQPVTVPRGPAVVPEALPTPLIQIVRASAREAGGSEPPSLPVARVPDPMSIESDGAPIVRLDDMDESPIPNYDDYFAYLADTQALGRWVEPVVPYQTARGCWWGEKTHCTFCGIS